MASSESQYKSLGNCDFSLDVWFDLPLFLFWMEGVGKPKPPLVVPKSFPLLVLDAAIMDSESSGIARLAELMPARTVEETSVGGGKC